MSSFNGGVPPSFRFHPTEVGLNKIEPWDLQDRCKIGSTPQNEWYFFSHKDRKYPTGSRTNCAIHSGFWKATGRDKCIKNCYKKIGMRKTLVFYKGRAPHGQKTDWIMHEYRIEDTDDDPSKVSPYGRNVVIGKSLGPERPSKFPVSVMESLKLMIDLKFRHSGIAFPSSR